MWCPRDKAPHPQGSASRRKRCKGASLSAQPFVLAKWFPPSTWCFLETESARILGLIDRDAGVCNELLNSLQLPSTACSVGLLGKSHRNGFLMNNGLSLLTRCSDWKVFASPRHPVSASRTSSVCGVSKRDAAKSTPFWQFQRIRNSKAISLSSFTLQVSFARTAGALCRRLSLCKATQLLCTLSECRRAGNCR